MIEKYKLYLKTLNYLDTTINGYSDDIRLFFEFIEEYKNIKISSIVIYNITTANIIAYITYLSIERKNSNLTINRKLHAIRNFYKFIQKIYKVPNPTDNINLNIIYKRLPKCLNLEDSKKVLSYFPTDSRNYLIIYLFLNYGLRLSELININIEDIDFKRQKILIKGKGNKIAEIHLTNDCIIKLKNYIFNREYGPLFTSKGKRIPRRTVQDIVSRVFNKLNLKGYTVHSLRHTFATIMYQRTKDILIVKELLRHESVVSTQIYAHINPDNVKEAVNNNPLSNFNLS